MREVSRKNVLLKFFFFAQKHIKLKFDSGFFETSNIITFLKDAVKVLRMGVKLL